MGVNKVNDKNNCSRFVFANQHPRWYVHFKTVFEISDLNQYQGRREWVDLFVFLRPFRNWFAGYYFLQRINYQSYVRFWLYNDFSTALDWWGYVNREAFSNFDKFKEWFLHI